MFAITSAVNAYDQEGDYLEVIFDSTPTLQQLSDWYYNTKLEKLNDEQLLFLAHLNILIRKNLINEKLNHVPIRI